MTVGERVKEVRKRKGFSVRYLSEESGISRSTISRWENNHLNPSEEKLKKVVKALGITMHDFWSEQPLGYVVTQTDINKGIREQIDRILHNLGDIQIAINILRENYGVTIGMVQKLRTEDSIYFDKGIDKAAKAVSRQAVEKDGYFKPITRKEFRYDWCDFVQHPKQTESHYYE